MTGIGLWLAFIVPPSDAKGRPMTLLYVNYLRGLDYYDYNKAIDHLTNKSELQLKLETDNKYDGFAISVWFENYQLGYVAAYENVILSNLMQQGLKPKTRVLNLYPYNAIQQRMAIAVYADFSVFAPQADNLKELSSPADDMYDLYRHGDLIY